MDKLPPLAFIDVETTGLDAAANRIAEIGIVFGADEPCTEWSCLLAPGARRLRTDAARSATSDADLANAPRFADIAAALQRRLAGRLLVAHNARFDYAFLRAEFRRAGIEFNAAALCSVMLSRALYPGHARHDLDSLVDRHGLETAVRHRALPDARLLAQFWRVIQRDHDREAIANTIVGLLAAPVLPESLDSSLIERLPDAPGFYSLHDSAGDVLRVAKAGNLRLEVLDYFRLDRVSTKALLLAERVKDVRWHVTRGMIGAQLKQAVFQCSVLSPGGLARRQQLFSWRLAPETYPCFELVSMSSPYGRAQEDCFGLFASERKARNALARLARAHSLCSELLGIARTGRHPCAVCDTRAQPENIACKARRLNHLLKIFLAIRVFRLANWPYRGPVGIRERSDLHIIDQWCYLGTARNSTEIHDLLTGRRVFDGAVFRFLAALLPTLAPQRIVDLNCASAPPQDSVESACTP